MSNLFAPGAAGAVKQAQTAAPTPQPNLPSPPHPALQAAGYNWGGIDDFNQRVQKVVSAYQAAHGTNPPAGLTLDVVRSQVQPEQYTNLFSPAHNPTSAKANAAVQQHKAANPTDYFVTRPDGVIQPNTAIANMIAHANPPASAPEPTQQQFLRQHPMVTMGILPIPSFQKLEETVKALNRPQGMAEVGQGVGNAQLGTPGVTPQEETALQKASTLRSDAVRVQTIRQAQVELNKAMGTNLPVTGVFNQTWTDSLSNWMKTTDYAKKTLAYQAQQSGFGNNVDAYEKAWHQKQRASRPGLYGWFMQSMPLPLFGHGGLWEDIASIPGYLKGSSNNPLNIGLHGLTKSAGLTLDTVGGTVTQAKADLAAGTTLAYDLTALRGITGKKPVTYEQALVDARKQLRANPSWLRALGFGQLPTEEKGWLKKLDTATNIAGDLILLRKPALTGERVAAGDVTAAAKSSYLRATSQWAYNDLLKYGQDGIGRAASRLESGQGARAFVARVAKQVQGGDMTAEQFRQHVAELYANGHTLVDKTEVSGPLLGSLRSDKLPTPGIPGRTVMRAKAVVREWSDKNLTTFDRGAGSSRAVSFASSLRNQVSHYIPARVGYMDEILPERVFNFVLKHKLGDDSPALANRLESVLVKAQGAENITRIQQVQRTLERLYYEKYTAAEAPKDDPFQAVLSTEAPSVFKFPAGGDEEIHNGLDAIQSNATKLNRTLNRLAVLHSRIILSGFNPATLFGGFSLFWKHLIGDTLRVEAGGGGILTGLDGEVRAAKAEINQLAGSDPELSRMLGAFRERATKGEANWLLNRGGNTYDRSFATGNVFDDGNYMAAAGGYLRRRLDDPALGLLGDKQALTQLVLHDRTYRGLWKAAVKKNPDLTAEDYADLIEEQYRSIGDALTARGLTWNDAKEFYNKVRGATADKQLGKWIKDNKLGFDVSHGQVEQIGTFDRVTGNWIGNVIMRPNKLNRGRFAENVLARTYADLTKAGWDKKTALQTATSVSGALTKYHMLDFANRLQVEQNLRWLSYFATKHRLYWKWVLGTFTRHPGYAAAVADFSQTLNQQGGWTLPYTFLGTKWQIPLERLVWVPGREYDETSPLALAVFNYIKSGGNLDAVVQGATGTNGNIITRSDTAVVLGTKLLKIELGKAAPTYGFATQGLDAKEKQYVTKALNEYQITFENTHGHYDTEANAVKKVLLAQAGEEYWRANLPLPVVPETDRSEQEQLLAQFMAIDDPRKRSQFLHQHPGFSDSFGVYNDPKTELHNRLYFQRWTKALDAYRSARASLYDQAVKTGQWTPALEKERRDLNASLNKTRNQLLIDDAQQSGINTHGLVPNGTTVPYGPWGKMVNKDPQFDTTHVLNTLFPKLPGAISDDVIGPMQKQMQAELAQLNDPNYVKASGYTPEEVKTRQVELLQKLQVFSSYPSDALGAVRDTYQTKFVNRYWQGYNSRYNAIAKLPSGERSTADAEFRAWRDSQDHPVKVNGITFPSPVRMAWAMLDPTTRQQRLSYLAGKPAADLADYELDLLGISHPQNVSAAMAAIKTAADKYREVNPGASLKSSQLVAVAKQVDKQPGYHGFYQYYVNTLSAPRIRQFEATSLYRDMPAAVKQGFDQIGAAAIKVTRESASGHSSYYDAAWRRAVKQDIEPWLDDPANKQLKAYLAPFGPNFLDDLVTQSTGV